MSPGAKVVVVPPPSCGWCVDAETPLVVGRVYTVEYYEPGEEPGEPGVVDLAETPSPDPGYGWCECQLRPVDGDPDAWRELLRSLSPSRELTDA